MGLSEDKTSIDVRHDAIVNALGRYTGIFLMYDLILTLRSSELPPLHCDRWRHGDIEIPYGMNLEIFILILQVDSIKCLFFISTQPDLSMVRFPMSSRLSE